MSHWFSTLSEEWAKLALKVPQRQAGGTNDTEETMTMNAQQLIIMAVVGIIAGWLASFVVGGPSGLIAYLITGLIGAFVGGWIFSAAGWKLNLGNDLLEWIVTSAIGAIVVVILAKLIIFG
jgi:uncharacterized membrane protein YeaQ/YmgE (transglycosylase-associated protein family)